MPTINAASELTSLTFKQGATIIGDLIYTYDGAGNRIKTGGTFARTSIPPALTTTSYNTNNQQTTFGTNTLSYDLNGNLATVTDAGGTATYTWNARNQLAAISVTGFTASFSYDSFGRRTGKTIQGVTTNFVYDGLNTIQEKNGGTVTANLLTGLGIDEFLTRTDGAGTRGLLTDALGSAVALGDSTGTLQTQYTYEPFGYVSQTGQANGSSYKYTGRENDGTGLYYYRARYYHPRLQRFVSEDPIGLRGGDVNLYGYVDGNPLMWRDPLGHFTMLLPLVPPLVDAGIAVGGIIAGGIAGQVIADVIDSIWSRNDWTGEPGSESECLTKGGKKKQTRRYGSDGYPDVDTDWDHDHGQGMPHVHDWNRPAGGGTPEEGNRGPGRKPVPGDPGFPKTR
jgi:RHS repeat-associated protein